MNGVYLYFVNKHLSGWPLLGQRITTFMKCTFAGLLGSVAGAVHPVKIENSELIIVNPFLKQSLFFMFLRCKSCENTEGKGEIARNEQFLLFPQCFLPIWRTFCHVR